MSGLIPVVDLPCFPRLNAVPMKRMIRSLLAFAITLLAACSSNPISSIIGTNEPKPSAAYEANDKALQIPPELQGEVSVPEPEQIAIKDEDGNIITSVESNDKTEGAIAGLDARIYDLPAGRVMSAVIDAMTSLNLPVESVDSPSGTITTDWTRQDANSLSTFVPVTGFLGNDGVMGVRYRFVVRVLRQSIDGVAKTRLEVRTIAQAFKNRHWVNTPLKRKVSEELFSSTEERLK